MSDKKTIVVWFSCGVASAVALKKTIEIYGKTHIIRAVNNPVINEHYDNQRFLNDVSKWCGIEIEKCVNSKYPNADINEVFKDRKYISGVAGAPCTQELKKKARQEWEAKNNYDYLVMGFTSDEIKRHERFKLNERENILPVLIDLGLTKEDCFKIVQGAGIKMPEIYSFGFPNANCIECVKSSSPAYWSLVRSSFPSVFRERAELSRKIGCKLVRYKNQRLFLDELPEIEFKKLRKTHVECGIFCEEK